MSSPRPSAASARSAKSRAPAALPPRTKPIRPAANASQPPIVQAQDAAGSSPIAAEAERIAAQIERALASGGPDPLSGAALQALMAALCKSYASRVEKGETLLPLPQRGGATATEVMITASGLLKSANLAVFELGMWQSWTGR